MQNGSRQPNRGRGQGQQNPHVRQGGYAAGQQYGTRSGYQNGYPPNGYTGGQQNGYSQRPPQGRQSPQPQRSGQYGQNPGQRQRPMTEREYQAYQRQRAATAAQRKRQAEVEKMMRKQEARRRRQRNRQVFLGRLAVFGVVLAIMAVLSVGLFLILFNHTPDAVDETKISYTYGGAKGRKVDFDTAYADGIYYFCFQDLADYLGMSETGSAAERRFLFVSDTADSRGDGEEEYVRFPDGEAAAIVNGQRISLDGPNRLIGEEVWVSVDFVTDVMENLSLTVDDDVIALAKVVDDTAETTEEEKDSVILYLDPAFRLKPVEPIDPVPEENTYLSGSVGDDEEIDMELANVTFTNDLTAYEQYMAPENRDGYLILVNTENTLSSDYAPTDLLDVAATAKGKTTQQLRQYANKALEALLLEMNSAGYTKMQVNSGYRTFSYQAMLFETYTNNELSKNNSLTREEAEKIVLTYSTRPGTSEHQTGLAVDMAIDASFSTDFQYTDEYKWLTENAWKFGFILRFPADKVDITTIQFEPWHWRYVGRYHAKKIHDLGVCLEEYIEILNASEE